MADVEPPAPGRAPSDRLDLDDLDPLVDLDSAVDLDVVGDDGPTASERLTGWLRERGVTDVVRRHPVAAVCATALVVAAAALGGWWWSSRPPTLPEPPGVVAAVSGEDPALAETSPDGQATQVQQAVDLTVTEARDVGIEVLGVTGPGLGDVAGLPIVIADVDRRDSPVPARGALACGTTAQTSALSGARDIDYRVVIRRNRGTTSAVDAIPLVGAQRLLDLIRSTCLQRAADRELRITGMSVQRLPGTAALRLEFVVQSTGEGTWTSLQIADAARPTLVPVGDPLTVVPQESALVHGNLRPADCADPASVISSGVLMSASPPGGAPPGGAEPPIVLTLHPGLQRAIVDSVRALCGAASAKLTIASALMRTGSRAGTGGTLDIELTVVSHGASAVKLVPSTTAAGRVTPQLQTPVHGSSVGPTRVTWELPPCAALVDTGLPQLHVDLETGAGSGRTMLPFLLPLDGDVLGVALNRLCPDVAPEIRTLG